MLKTPATGSFAFSPELSLSPMPYVQTLHSKSLPRSRKLQIIVKDSLLYVFHLGVASSPSFSVKKSLLKVLKLGQA